MLNNTNIKTKELTKPLLSPGHRACAGCGQLIAARLVIEALGRNTIIANATGCLEVTTTPYLESAWGVPWIHSLFENASSVASGIYAALKYSGHDKKIKILAQAGDGGTFDIGLGLISGMWERNENIIYVCYDNEAYANTGMQASAATPIGANTTTTPASKSKIKNSICGNRRKKNMIAIALAHGLKYVAETTIGYPEDITQKVKKAAQIEGPSYIQILTSCIPGWGINTNQAINIGKLACESGLYPVFEYIDGQLLNVKKIGQDYENKLENYLKNQDRFKHLFKSEGGKKEIEIIKLIAIENIKKYSLL